jgi:hypothetical protein
LAKSRKYVQEKCYIKQEGKWKIKNHKCKDMNRVNIKGKKRKKKNLQDQGFCWDRRKIEPNQEEWNKLWPKIKDSKRENERELKLNCFTYYIDALMTISNNSPMINRIIMDARNEASFRLDVDVREFAFIIYKINQNFGNMAPMYMNKIMLMPKEIQINSIWWNYELHMHNLS